MSSAGQLNVWSLGTKDATEDELVRRFFEGVDKYTPVLVSWNGRGFDLPVLHYRALLHGIQAPRYWETGDEDQSFRWNNYLSRFHQRHTDLMDIIAGYDNRAFAPLNDVAAMLGFPGKLGMDGSQVWNSFLAGNIEAIRNYCETDVLNTYLIYLRYELMRGNFTGPAYKRECDRLREYLKGEKKEHFTEFLNEWDDK